MPLGTEVGLDTGHIVLQGDPAPLKRGHSSSTQFSAHVCYGQTAGWIKVPLGMDVGLDPDHIVLDEDPAPIPSKQDQPPLFSIHVYCAKRSPISATAELLFE